MMQEVHCEIGVATLLRFKVQQSHYDRMLRTVAMHDLANCIIFVRLASSVFDLGLARELSALRGIHRNGANLAYMVTKVA